MGRLQQQISGTKITISPTEATVQVFWTASRTLPKKEREAILEKFLTEKEFMEDLIDILILKQREKEPYPICYR